MGMPESGPVGVTDAELTNAIRRLRAWNKMPAPSQLSKHAVTAACFLRVEIAEDIRSSVELDGIAIAKHKAGVRKIAAEKTAEQTALVGSLSYSSWEALDDNRTKLQAELSTIIEAAISNAASVSMDGAPSTQTISPLVEKRRHELEELLNAIGAGRDAWIERRRLAVEAATAETRAKHEANLLPYPPQTRAQKEVSDRIEHLLAAQQQPPVGESAEVAARRLNLCTLIKERLKKRPSQKTLDRLLQATTEFDSAQRPLHRALLWMRETGRPTDDISLLGVEPGTVAMPRYRRAEFGYADPDSKTPALRVPRRPTRLTLTASASTTAKVRKQTFHVFNTCKDMRRQVRAVRPPVACASPRSGAVQRARRSHGAGPFPVSPRCLGSRIPSGIRN